LVNGVFPMDSKNETLAFAIKILTLLRSTNGLDQRAIFKQTKIPPKSLVRTLDYLEQEKLVDVIEHSGYFIYNINENGQMFLKQHTSSKNGATKQKNENKEKGNSSD